MFLEPCLIVNPSIAHLGKYSTPQLAYTKAMRFIVQISADFLRTRDAGIDAANSTAPHLYMTEVLTEM